MKKNGIIVKSEEPIVEVESTPEVPEAPKPMVNTLDFNGRCGNCFNPFVSMFGEGKWRCVCGAHS